MVLRHESFGHSPADARARTFGSDEANAVLVNRSGSGHGSAGSGPDVWIEHTV
jgi:hypothetical protein